MDAMITIDTMVCPCVQRSPCSNSRRSRGECTRPMSAAAKTQARCRRQPRIAALPSVRAPSRLWRNLVRRCCSMLNAARTASKYAASALDGSPCRQCPAGGSLPLLGRPYARRRHYTGHLDVEKGSGRTRPPVCGLARPCGNPSPRRRGVQPGRHPRPSRAGSDTIRVMHYHSITGHLEGSGPLWPAAGRCMHHRTHVTHPDSPARPARPARSGASIPRQLPPAPSRGGPCAQGCTCGPAASMGRRGA
jgi:hypothetical protein